MYSTHESGPSTRENISSRYILWLVIVVAIVIVLAVVIVIAVVIVVARHGVVVCVLLEGLEYHQESQMKDERRAYASPEIIIGREIAPATWTRGMDLDLSIRPRLVDPTHVRVAGNTAQSDHRRAQRGNLVCSQPPQECLHEYLFAPECTTEMILH
ncbi:hypothetical protein BC834DRAFT_642395 [Gloeopeniophorella convolvens]|nr:hypothetical protein BC834DRAFT_642395 [Gloeopeniophorella convolvens]